MSKTKVLPIRTFSFFVPLKSVLFTVTQIQAPALLYAAKEGQHSSKAPRSVLFFRCLIAKGLDLNRDFSMLFQIKVQALELGIKPDKWALV